MIKDLEKVPYNKKHPEKDTMKWYTWTEICDRCGKIIRNNGDIITGEKPNTNEKNYCLQCLRIIYHN